MGRAFEYRKAAKLKRWGHMAKTFTRLGKQIAIAVKAGGPEPENNPTLRSVIATCKRENMPKDNIERAIKNAMGKDQSDYKSMTYEGYGPHGIAVFVDTLTDNTTRTVADVRSVFNKFGGNLGTMGSRISSSISMPSFILKVNIHLWSKRMTKKEQSLSTVILRAMPLFRNILKSVASRMSAVILLISRTI